MLDESPILPFSWELLLIAAGCLVLIAFGTLAESVMQAAGGRFRTAPESTKEPATPYDRLLDKPDYYLSTALLLSRLAIITAAVIVSVVALSYFEPVPALVGTLVVVGVLVIAIGEIVPRAVANQDPGRVARLISGPLRMIAWLMTPLLWILGLLTNSIAHLFGLRPMARAPLVTEAEFLSLLKIGHREGTIQEVEREMISGIFELEETLAREIMVPRIDIVGVSTEATLDDVIETTIAHGYSRIPLYEGNLDHIIGIIYVKDVLRALHRMRQGEPAPTLPELARPGYFVPETKRINELLHELQTRRVHLAIVVDEYGGTAGLVTIEDMLEEIVGEIQDEYDVAEETEIVEISPIEAEVSGRASIDTLQELFDYDVTGSDYDTIGGFIYGHLGRMPAAGDIVRVDSLELTVLNVAGNRIRRVRVIKTEVGNGDAESPGQPA